MLQTQNICSLRSQAHPGGSQPPPAGSPRVGDRVTMRSRRRQSAIPVPQPSLWEDATAWSRPLMDLASEVGPHGSDASEDGEPGTSPDKEHQHTATDAAAPGTSPQTRRPPTPSFVCEVPLRVPRH